MKFPLLGKTLAVGGVLIALTLALQSISAIVSDSAAHAMTVRVTRRSGPRGRDGQRRQIFRA